MAPVTEYVTTYRGHKAHLRSPDNKHATWCGRAIDPTADLEQVERHPELLCQQCVRRREHQSEGI